MVSGNLQLDTQAEAVASVVAAVESQVYLVQPAKAVATKLSAAVASSQAGDAAVVLTEPTDPFSVISSTVSADPSKLTTVTTSSETLLTAIPYLSELAGSATVIHVELTTYKSGFADYSYISSLRNLGFVFLQSFDTPDARDIALASYAIAQKLSTPVVHFFYPVSDSQTVQALPADTVASFLDQFAPESVQEGETNVTASVEESVASVLHSLKSISSSYSAFDYYGPRNASEVIVIFGAPVLEIKAAIKKNGESGRVGVVAIRTYRPFSAADFAAAVPSSVKSLAVLEQTRNQTTSWSPLILDLFSEFPVIKEALPALSQIVAFQVGIVNYENVSNAVKSVLANIRSANPIQNLYLGAKPAGDELSKDVLAAIAAARKHEDAYIKMLKQVWGKKLDIINGLGEDKLAAVGLETSPEFSYGRFLAREDQKAKLIDAATRALARNDWLSPEKATLHDLLSAWVVAARDSKSASAAAAAVDVEKLVGLLESDGSESAKEILQYKSLLPFKSSWIIGSDAWAYDLGSSGIHSVISGGKNVNMLIVDSEPQGSAVPGKPRKKDIGLYAMNFGGVYVASVAVYSSYTQVLHALLEAEAFPGPSIVLAYLPYKSEHDDALTILQETKKAVSTGYWPLYRWNPSRELKEEEAFQLDSSVIKRELQEFLDRENKLTLLSKRDPDLHRTIKSSYGTEVREQQKSKAKQAYLSLLDGLSGAPVTILFASDGGNAENVAKRLGRRAKSRGLKPLVMAMDDFPLEDLPSEENVVFITSTSGQGEFPQNGKNMWEALKGSTDTDLAAVKYSVFGLGDSHYWPRKQDKIYYNKPAKDLDAKLELFGGSRLAPLGLGDDQDADGWSTGYDAWEPLLWEALGVSGVGNADEPPPITNEDIKLASNFLRGTIAEGLKDESTGAISAADQQLTKFHGIYLQDDRDIRDARKAQGLEPAYAFMVRVRLPGSVATPAQWLKIDELADSRGNGTFKLTTRGTFQLHGVVKRDLKPAIRGMNMALMDTLAACGDVNRNVMCSALPGNQKVQRQAVEVASEISEYLLPATLAYHEIWLEGKDPSDGDVDAEAIFNSRKEGPRKTLVAGQTLVDQEPLYGPTYLPRKFKVTICIPPYNDTDVYAHDVGLIAIVDDQNQLIGFNVLAGGGMGTTHNNKKTYPRTGSMMGFVTTDKVKYACENIMKVQRDFGDRKNRKHARLKYTVDDMGVDEFRAKVEEYWGEKFAAPRPFELTSNVDHFGWITDEEGEHHFTCFIENGRVEDTPELPQRTGLRKIAEILDGEFRLTGNQHVIISRVKDHQLDLVKSLLKEYKLDNTDFSGLRLSSAACVAFPTCGLAMAESERYLPVLIGKLEAALEEYGLRHDSVVMRMTGCPNGCARPWLAEVACVGKAYGTYNLMLGGGYFGQRLNKLYRSSVNEEQILAILKPLFKRWALERNDGEHFGDFLIRVGVIKPTLEGKYFHDDVEEEDEE